MPDQRRSFELLEDHHDILFVDFDLLPQFMQIMLGFGAPQPSFKLSGKHQKTFVTQEPHLIHGTLVNTEGDTT